MGLIDGNKSAENDESVETNKEDKAKAKEVETKDNKEDKDSVQVLSGDNITQLLTLGQYDMLAKVGELAYVATCHKAQYKDGTIVCTDKDGHVTKIIEVGDDSLTRTDIDEPNGVAYPDMRYSRSKDIGLWGDGVAWVWWCNYTPEELHEELREDGFDV